MSDAEQYLDLIAENAQIKAEIQALKVYGSNIRLFDRMILKICADQTIGKDNELPNFKNIINNIKQGIPPVESAESFKQIMMAERNVKLSEKQKMQIAKYKQLQESLANKNNAIQELIKELEEKIAAHQKVLNEGETIQGNIQKQLDKIKADIENTKNKTNQLTDEVTESQAIGLELRRNIDKAQTSLSQCIKYGSFDQEQADSILSIVGNLKQNRNAQSFHE